MEPYDVVLMREMPGDTPSEKYENYKWIMETLRKIAYPRRNTHEEDLTIYDFAEQIQKRFNVDSFEE